MQQNEIIKRFRRSTERSERYLLEVEDSEHTYDKMFTLRMNSQGSPMNLVMHENYQEPSSLF